VCKGVDLTGLLGGHKRRLGFWGTSVPQNPSGVQGQSPGKGYGGLRPPYPLPGLCIKIQQTTVAVTRVDMLNDITSKILGVGTLPWMSPPLHKYWGYMSPLSHRDRRPCGCVCGFEVNKIVVWHGCSHGLCLSHIMSKTFEVHWILSLLC